jgi:hypothetical protein
MIETIISRIEESVEDLQQKYYGVCTGRVINMLDPMMLGRVQVQLPFIDSIDLSPWARIATLFAGPISGSYFIPNIGDEVLVAFEHGDVKAPYIIGSLWNAMAPPPLPSPLPQIREIRTLAGNTIMIMEIPPSIMIMTATGQTIFMSPTGIQIVAGTNVINMSPDGITAMGPNINLIAGASVSITAPNVTINGASAASVMSGGVATVQAPLVMIN